MSQVTGIILREDFKIAKQLFAEAFNPRMILNSAQQKVANPKYQPDWDPVQAFCLTQSELRLEQPLVANNATITFPVLSNIQNQAQQYPAEIRLSLQDSFVPTRIGVYVGVAASAVTSAVPLHTFFNPTVFANSIAEENFYNGQLRLMINNRQFIRGWGLQRHRVVNQTQQIVTPIATGVLYDQIDGSSDALYPMQPFVLLLGSADIQLTIQLPAALTAVGGNDRVVLRIEGVLAQNSTVVN